VKQKATLKEEKTYNVMENVMIGTVLIKNKYTKLISRLNVIGLARVYCSHGYTVTLKINQKLTRYLNILRHFATILAYFDFLSTYTYPL
jgi:hypothetical protein